MKRERKPRKPRAPRAPRARTLEKIARAERISEINLNETYIPAAAGEGGDVQLAEPGNAMPDGVAEVHFRYLPERLIAMIREADFVFGCVAWMTHPGILDALVGKSVCIIVQKEDFLRPDLAPEDGWRAWLREKYDRLECQEARTMFNARPGRVGLAEMSYCGDSTLDAVRCVGNHNRDRTPAFPRSHHKFVVFGKYVENAKDYETEGRDAALVGYGDYPWGILTAAWTGSFNFTKNGGASLENAVVLRHPDLVRAFFEEFQQVAALSEPLDWTDEWMAPEWRIGS